VTVRIDHGVTSGTFSLDGESFEVDNNVWVVGDDAECLVIDAPHWVEGILGCLFTGDTLFPGGPGATRPLLQRPPHPGGLDPRHALLGP
jgi:glyoxylase-like metal-dependent hydrolase (beta-lactamase superfamily II)